MVATRRAAVGVTMKQPQQINSAGSLRRYLLNRRMPDAGGLTADVVIVGCGAAGLYAALSLNPSLSCILINKCGSEHSNSMDAQGGIAAVLKLPGSLDNPESHIQDTLIAGAGCCDETAVGILVREAQANIENLVRLGVPFDQADGQWLLTREGGHSERRILHAGGDATGFHLTSALYQAAAARINIRILDQLYLSDILTDNQQACGIAALDDSGRVVVIRAPRVILASGGIGRLFRNSTNAAGTTGDGLAAAIRAGTDVKDLAFVQFHPTALAYPDEHGRFFLISEALRGEGAILRNRHWDPFMQGQHPRADLAPRDIVTRAIIREMKTYDIPCVYLDITMKPRAYLKNRFPTIYNTCMQRGIDIARDWIPVVPVQHYFMGGIRTDYDGRTSIDGLYACGETACTGVHGANRLASNSLIECIVFGGRCARHINASDAPAGIKPAQLPDTTMTAGEEADFDAIIGDIRSHMTLNCGILRNGEDLATAGSVFQAYLTQLEQQPITGRNALEAINGALVAWLVAADAIRRQESIGAHYRTDFPAESQTQA